MLEHHFTPTPTPIVPIEHEHHHEAILAAHLWTRSPESSARIYKTVVDNLINLHIS